jgi:hypothetical protein
MAVANHRRRGRPPQSANFFGEGLDRRHLHGLIEGGDNGTSQRLDEAARERERAHEYRHTTRERAFGRPGRRRATAGDPPEEAAVRPRPNGAPGGQEVILKRLESMQRQLDRIEQRMTLAVAKEAYSTDEVAERLSPPRTPWTVRQWCNLGQARAWKVAGRGRKGEWRIGHEELVRLQNEGASSPGTFDNETGGRHPASRRVA